MVGAGVVATFFWTAHRQNRDAERADAAAERAEAAAALSIDQTMRIADALEKLAERPVLRVGESRAIERRVAWSLTWSRGDAYLLTNVGDGTAFGVKIEHDPSLIVRAEDVHEEIAPGEAVEFFALRSMATIDSTITVTWTTSRDAEDREQWRYPLPARPKR
ncbi:hypothetical protein [Gryllotalpicola daejeonensis]|uniref:hypothetical protein n=1 Tax=Gryllotalpicola daejeonensis TaxID=993087 RepID=UPI0031D46610